MRARQGRSRSRPLRGTLLAWVAPAHEPVPGGCSLPGPIGRQPASGDLGQSERKESSGPSGRLRSLTALLPSVPEIRYLLARVLLRPPVRTRFIMACRSGDEDTKPKPPLLTTAVKLKRNCNIRVKLSCCGAFGEGYVEAELVEPLGEAISQAGALGALEVVGAEAVVIHPAPEHDVHRREDRPGHRHNGLLRAPAGLQSQKQRPEVAALGSDPAPGRLDQQGLEPRRTRPQPG